MSDLYEDQTDLAGVAVLGALMAAGAVFSLAACAVTALGVGVAVEHLYQQFTRRRAAR